MNEATQSMVVRVRADATWHKDAAERRSRAERRFNRISWPLVGFMWLALLGSAIGLTPYWLWVASAALLVAVLAWQGTWMFQEGARERRHLRSGDHVQYADLRVWLYGDPS